MTEQDLIDLGFEKTDLIDLGLEGINEDTFYYYALDLVRGLELISNDSDDLVDGKWYVELYEADRIRFVDKENLEEFITIVKRNII
jgi:hypothetical protein